MLSDSGTLTVTLYVLVAPLSAVTRTVTTLSPTRRPVLPEIATEDVAAVAVATTGTVVVPGATSTTLFTEPLTVNVDKVTSVDSGRTFNVTV